MRVVEIQDPEKGTITYNFANAISITKFNAELARKDSNFKLQKVASISQNPNKAPGYEYKDKTDLWEKTKEGFVYAITLNGSIVKIGMTEKTLLSRFSSYTAGTRAARDKGTCSTTNYYCSEFIRTAQAQGAQLEIYAFHIPTAYVDTEILGTKQTLIAKQAYAYEDALLKIHEQKLGTVPVLCRNTSLL